MEVVQSKEHEYLKNIESLKNELHSVSINLSNKVNLRNTSKEDHDRKDIQVNILLLKTIETLRHNALTISPYILCLNWFNLHT